MESSTDTEETHPAFCAPGLCHRGSAELDHEEVPEVVTVPAGDRRRPLTLALHRSDEFDDEGRQVCRPVDYVLGIGNQRSYMTNGQVRHLRDRLNALLDRGEAEASLADVPHPR